MERIKKILYDMRSSLKSEMRTRWMTEDEIKSNNELQSEITEVISIIEREGKESKQQSNCNLTHVMGELTCDSCGCHPNVIYTTSKGRFCERCKPAS